MRSANHQRGDARLRNVLLTTMFLVLSYTSLPVDATLSGEERILLLHSYHSGMSWADSVTRGVENAFQSDLPSNHVHVEHMDTKRHLEPEYFNLLLDVYRHKFSLFPPDVVITADDTATRFAIKHRSELFPGAPIVFCGVNSYRPDEFKEVPAITGVVEAWDVRGTLDIALALHPDAKQVFIVNDTTPTGLANRRTIDSLLPRFKDRADFTYLGPRMTMDELLARMKRLPEDSLVLLMSFNRDAAGHVFGYRQAADKICGASERPVYGIWEFYLGHGIVGGNLTSGEAQGRTAARIARQVLQGTPARDIPIVTESPNRLAFDYRQMVRFGINPGQLPAGSDLINRRPSLYSQYRAEVWATIIAIITLLCAVVLLYLNIMKRRRVEFKLQDYQAHLQDLVERRTKSLTAAVRRQEQEIERRKQADARLQETMQELRESNSELEQFAYIASHDLQEPLRTVGSFAKLLSRRYKGRLDKEADEFIEFMTDAVKRGQALVDDLLEYSRIQRRGKPFEPVDTREEMKYVLENLAFAINDTGAQIFISDDLPEVDADPSQLPRVFQNLLSNALQAGREDTQLEIRAYAHRQDDMWQFTIEDNGVGVEPANAESAFNPFQSYRRASGKKMSTGMGLAICKKIIERHGGSIWIDSTPGEGTRVHFTLPVQSKSSQMKTGTEGNAPE